MAKVAPFQKLLTVLVSGKPVTVEEIEATLGKEIHMYRLSTYIWHIKSHANGIVRVIKDGRKVTAYQIVNVNEMAQYLGRLGINYVPGSTTIKPSISKLADLKAEPVDPAQVDAPVVVDELVVTEVTA